MQGSVLQFLQKTGFHFKLLGFFRNNFFPVRSNQFNFLTDCSNLCIIKLKIVFKLNNKKKIAMKTSITNGDFVKYSIPDTLKKHISFLKYTLLPVTLLCLWLIGGCVSMAPVNSSFESAKTLGKGNVELMGSYSAYKMRYEDYDYVSDSYDKVSAKVNDNFGFRLGYGVSDRVDFKIRYERMIPAMQEDKDYLSGGVNYFAFTTRCSFWENYITGAMDIGLYGYKEKDYEDRLPYFLFQPENCFQLPFRQTF